MQSSFLVLLLPLLLSLNVSTAEIEVCDERGRYFNYSMWLPSLEQMTRWKRSTPISDSCSSSTNWIQSVKDLSAFIYNNDGIYNLTIDMIESWNELTKNPNTPELNCNITNIEPLDRDLCVIINITDFLDAINCIIQMAPPFHGNNLIGVPLAAFLTGFDATLSGQSLFRMKEWNAKIQNILASYNWFLNASLSNYVFNQNGSWVENKEKWNYEMWQQDNTSYPWYNSWNSFFTREFKNQSKDRPISNPTDDNVITSSNDGALFRWRKRINRTDGFWFKDMPYSLTDIFKSSNTTQQLIFDNLKLVDVFEHGTIFQTFLDPFNYHRWWSPISGKVAFDPIVIDESPMYFSKIVLPDYQGSTTYSIPYLLQVNSRGILILDTTGYANIGYVAIMPIGMCEVSSIYFRDTLGVNRIITKGDEIGYFQFGGSSFAILFEDLSKYNKKITFQNDTGYFFPMDPPLPNPTGSNPNEVILNIGSKIATISNLF